MEPMIWLAARVFAVAGGALVAAVWQGSVMCLVTAMALRVLPPVPARVRSMVWLAVMGLVAVLPFLHTRQVGAGGSVRVGLVWTFGLGAVWVGMSLVRAGRLVWSAAVLHGVARRAVVIESPAAVAALLDGVKLCVSDEVAVPSVAGFFRPRVLLPVGVVETLSESELTQIVVHEMEHLRRRDDWTNLLQKVMLVVFPLNPALVWVERKICAERELACDDAVLRATGAPKAYASCLAHLAEHTLVRRGVSLALGAWERRPELARRVQRILAGARNEGGLGRSRGVVAAMMVLVLGGAVGLSRSPEVVRFTGAVETLPVAEMVAPGSLRMPDELVNTRFAGDAIGGRLVLASARMDEPRGSKSQPAPRVVRTVAAKKTTRRARVVTVNAERRVLPPWYVLARAMEEDAPRLVPLTFDTGSQFSYAAVPVRNGWLIIQL